MASVHPSAAGSNSADVPGAPVGLGTAALDKGAGLLQGIQQKLQPVSNIHQHLCAFHVYAHDLSRQVEAHHFCSHLNEDVQQCLIYDTDAADARLIGVEYVVAESVFASLLSEEKQLWHSHEYEVKSGTLVLPGVPKVAEQAVLRKLAKTYGKTWHFWQFDRGDKLPLGLPQLMGAVTEDGQLAPALVEARDRKYGLDTAQLRQERQDIEGPQGGVDPAADYHRSGKGLVTELLDILLM